MTTRRYLLGALILLLPTLLLVTAINFVIIRLAPGNPAILLAGPDATVAQVQAIQTQLGLDRPVLVQLAIYYRTLLSGDLGYSFSFRQPVAAILLPRLLNTALLGGTALVISVLVGSALGIAAACKPEGVFDRLGVAGSVVLYSTPSFLLGVVLILTFSVTFRLLPTEGMFTLGRGWADPGSLGDVLRHMVLPVATLSIPSIALFARMIRSSMIEVIGQDYITLARSKGLGERSVILRHALRNALLGSVTLIGLAVANLLIGSTVVETVFSWPGMGRLMYESVGLRDYNLLLGGFIVFSLAQLMASFVTDVLYTRLDPRVRY